MGPNGTTRSRRSMRKVILFPLLFLLIVAPIAVFVASGTGTHMSPLLLYPFASPWWIWLFRDYQPGTEVGLLLIGCGINLVLVACAGLLLDRRNARVLR
jgi:hypothetical protein